MLNLTRDENGKVGVVTLLKHAFPTVTVAEVKELTDQDRIQLGSAIARNLGVAPTELKFEPVEY